MHSQCWEVLLLLTDDGRAAVVSELSDCVDVLRESEHRIGSRIRSVITGSCFQLRLSDKAERLRLRKDGQSQVVLFLKVVCH